MSWKKPEGPVSGYMVSLSPKDHQEDQEIRILDANKVLIEFGCLIGGTTYLVGILTLDGQNESQVVQVEGLILEPQSELV